eukprot:2741100-Pyramimonas_sp.AAC.1
MLLSLDRKRSVIALWRCKLCGESCVVKVRSRSLGGVSWGGGSCVVQAKLCELEVKGTECKQCDASHVV